MASKRKGSTRQDAKARRRLWIGVSASSLDARPNESWWCAPKDAAPGDSLVMYQRLLGIARLERIESPPEIRESRCSDANLLTVKTRFLFAIDPPITARELRTHTILRDLAAVRRSFQGTCFRVPEEYLLHLWRLVEARRGRAAAANKARSV